MKRNLLRAPGLVMLLLTPTAIFSQNLPPIAVNDTVYMCASTITIYVQDNDSNPDGDPLTLSIYAGSINGYFGIYGGTINYTPNVGYSGLDSLVYVLSDDGTPPLCDTAVVYIHVNAEYNINESATICDGDSIFLSGQWRTTAGMYVDSLTSAYGCDSVITTTLNVITPPQATITASGPTSFCDGDSVTLTASAGTSWLWSNGATTQSITVSASGTFSVQVSDTSACQSQSASVTVTESPAPQATISPGGPIAICSGDSVTLTANTGISWLWSTGDTTQSIIVDNSGSYTVTVDYGPCASTSSPVVVAELPVPNADITFDGSLTICQGDSIELIATAGPYSYYWSTGDTTNSIIVDTSGTFYVTITDPAGCASVSASVTVTLSVAPPANVIANGPTSLCQGDSVTLTATNGDGWLWSTGDTTQSIVVTTAGSYSVTINHGLCSRTSAPVTVTIDSVPTATISASGPLYFCEGDSVTLTASAGDFYLWSNGATTQSITVDTTGTFSVTVTNAAGCSAQSPTVSVTTGPALQATITPAGPVTFCAGDSAVLTANAGSSWLWSNGETTQSITVYNSGSYSVTVNYGSCSSTSDPVVVIELPTPNASIIVTGSLNICEGDSVILSAIAGPYSYYWSTGDTAQFIVVDTAGTFSVSITNAAGCTDISASVTVSLSNAPAATITASGPLSFCEGGSVTLTASNGNGYLWSTGEFTQSITVQDSGAYSVIINYGLCSRTSAPVTVNVTPVPVASISPAGPVFICQGDSVTLTASAGASWLWSTGETTQSITVNATGMYSVVVSNSPSCSDSASVAVNILSASAASISPNGPTTFCEGGSVTLTASNGNSWLWSTGETSQSIVVDSAGSYSVTIDYGMCSFTSDPVTVNVIPAPVASISPSGPVNICQGDSVTLTASGGSAWNWSTGETSQSITVNTTAVYSVTIYNTSGCSDQAHVAVNVGPAASATITANGPTTFCVGDYVTLTASNGQSWLWSTGDTLQSITVDTSGYYSVTVNNGFCTSTSAPITVIVLPAPIAGISAGGPVTFCEGQSVTLYATGGSSYTWSTGATTQNITVSDAGTYYVIVSNGACTDTSASIAVNVNAAPVVTITAGGPTTFCNGDSVLLTANGGNSWLWSNGATTQSVYWSASGNASVTATGANGCSATSAPIAINALPAPVYTVTADGPTQFCAGGSCVLTANNGTSWLWSTGDSAQFITVNSAGTYYVITSGECGSDTSDIFTITVDNGPPVAGFSATGNGFDYQFTNTSTGGTSYTWIFGDNSTSTEHSPLHSFTGTGPYMVTLITTNSCGADTAVFPIEFPDAQKLTIYNGFSPNGDGHNDFWNVPLLDNYKANTVTIVNRWGSEVWKAENYDNRNTRWAGTNLNGEDLPDGTYYYIIGYEGQEARGWVFIKR